MRRNLLAAAIGLTVAIASSVLIASVVRAHADHRRAVDTYHQDVKQWRAIRRGCGQSVSDRILILAQAQASSRANHLVATDPAQPRRTRKARAAEVRAYNRVIAGYRLRVPPMFNCAAAFPKPSVPAGVTPLP